MKGDDAVKWMKGDCTTFMSGTSLKLTKCSMLAKEREKGATTQIEIRCLKTFTILITVMLEKLKMT